MRHESWNEGDHEPKDVRAASRDSGDPEGSPPHDTFAPLALLTSDEKKDREALEKCVRYHAGTTKAEDSSWLIKWHSMAAGIVLSECYLATGERWVIPNAEPSNTQLAGTKDHMHPKHFRCRSPEP